MISAIVLAAGTSSRMGTKNKLIRPFRGTTFIETVVDELLASKVDEIIVVLGYEEENIRVLLANRKVKFTVNKNYSSGMTSSIKEGIKMVGFGQQLCSGYLICLSDMPFLTNDDYNLLLNSISGNKEILVPFHLEKNGNPVFFSSHFTEELRNHQEPEGCRGVVVKNKEFIKKVSFDTNHVLTDVDTEDDFREIS